jgi:hypothetical protein
MKSSIINETDDDIYYGYWTSNHKSNATISINNSLHNKCMNLRHSCVFGFWEVLSIYKSRRENVVGFDHEATRKRNLPIVSASTVVDLPVGTSIILTDYSWRHLWWYSLSLTVVRIWIKRFWYKNWLNLS